MCNFETLNDGEGMSGSPHPAPVPWLLYHLKMMYTVR